MPKTYHIKSPAKINIGLRILSRRKDGFHNLETIFYPVGIFDNIKITTSPVNAAASISINTKFKNKKYNQNLNNQNNICYRAVKLFLERFKIKGNYKIHIDILKQIPAGAGLGGGSSNAASVLKVLAKHFLGKTAAKIPAIKKLALELGSDVPFFLLNKPAYATGRGEKLIPLPKFKINYDILIALPGIHVSTAWAFKELRITNYELRNKKILNGAKTFRITEAEKYINIFEEPVFRKYPAIGKLKQKLIDSGAVFASMSGSGSAVYGFFKKQAKVKSKKAKKD